MRQLTKIPQLPLRKSRRIKGVNLCMNIMVHNELLKPQVNLTKPPVGKLAKLSPKSYGEFPFNLFSECIYQGWGKCDVIDAAKH